MHNPFYTIFRLNEQTLTFDSIGITNQSYYKDENLINGSEYCYYIRSIGYYDDTTIVRPLYNKSQIQCAIPYDNVHLVLLF